jgi:hypothetical protein
MSRTVRGILITVLLIGAAGIPAATLAAPAAGAKDPVINAASGFSFSTNPPLSPAFSPSTFDYVVRCTSGATTTLTTTGTGRVNIGGTYFNGPVAVSLALTSGQEVKVVQSGSAYYIRCLPADFPNYTSVVSGTPQAGGYFLTISNYAVVFDDDGVPVWWYSDPNTPLFDGKFLNSTTVA